MYDNYAKIIHAAILVLIFSLSFYIRSPWLDKPISNVGWVTAHTLITVEIWNRDGISTSAATPVYTYQETDAGHCIFAGVQDEQGRCYYVSYPPGGFLGPFVFFKITGLETNEKNLRIFNMLLQFISALFLYLILLKVHRLTFSNFCLPALIAFVLYCFLPVFLFFHSEIYFSDTLAQPLFYICIYLFLVWKDSFNSKILILFFIVYFVFLMTEWLSVMTGITLFAFVFFLKISGKEKIKFLLSLCMVSILAAVLFIVQYSSINDFNSFYEASINKYIQRSGASGTGLSEYGYSLSNPKSYSFLTAHFNGWFLPLINLTGLLVPLWLCLVIFFKRFRISSGKIQLILLLFFPVFLHLLILFNFNVVHEMAIMKVAGFLIIIISIAISSFLLISQKNKIKYSIAIALSGLIVFKSYQSVITYYKKCEDLYAAENDNLRMGTGIREHTGKNDLVMVNLFTSPEMIWYAKRNPLIAMNLEEAKRILIQLNKKNAVFFEKADSSFIFYRLEKNEKNEITISQSNF